MAEFEVHRLFESASVAVKDVLCGGGCRHRSPEECASSTHLVFPYRGMYMRHVGRTRSVADANHVLLFNEGEGYQVSHPVAGGDASLVLAIAPGILRELAPVPLRHPGDREPAFRAQSLRIEPRTQALVALLRHGLASGGIEALEAESLALALAARSLGPGTAEATRAMPARRRLVDRAKVLLSDDPGRRWTLAAIASEVGGSPVYLTQAFRQVEGIPLYRYHLRLRLARALDLVVDCEDVSALAMDLGFSSHSHFSAAFKRLYGCTPAGFRQTARRGGITAALEC